VSEPFIRKRQTSAGPLPSRRAVDAGRASQHHQAGRRWSTFRAGATASPSPAAMQGLRQLSANRSRTKRRQIEPMAVERAFGQGRTSPPTVAGGSKSVLVGPLKSRRAWRHRGRAPVRSRPCRSASPPKRWTCCYRWPRRFDQRQRDQFLHEVAAELEAASAQTGIGPGLGVLHRVGRVVQRSIGILRNCPTREGGARLKAKFKAGTLRRRRNCRFVERPGFSHGPALGMDLPPRKLDGGGRDAVAASVPATLL
jgi:hypothetical protein